MSSINSRNGQKLNNIKVDIVLLFTLILIGMISIFEPSGLYPTDQVYATNVDSTTHGFLNQYKYGNVQIDLQKPTTTANQSFAAGNKTQIIGSSHGIKIGPATAQGLSANAPVLLGSAQGLSGAIAQNVFCSITGTEPHATLNINKAINDPTGILTSSSQAANTPFTLNVINNGIAQSITLSQSAPLSICLNPGTFGLVETSSITGFNFPPTYQLSLSGGTTTVTTSSSCSSSSISGNQISAGQIASCTITNTASSTTANNQGTIISSAQGIPSSSTSASGLLATAQGLGISTTSNKSCIGGLPCGSWLIVSNALPGNLSIASVDKQGKVNGTVFGQNINGTWDQILRKVSFTQTIISGSNRAISYQYIGFYHNICGIAKTEFVPSCIIISGSAIPKTLPPEQAAKQEFGWIAIWQNIWQNR